MICWEWGQRGKEDDSRFSSTQLGEMNLRSSKSPMACLRPICCPGKSSPLFSMGCLLKLGGVWDKATSRARGSEGWLVGATADVSSGEERLPLVFCGNNRDQIGGLNLGK